MSGFLILKQPTTVIVLGPQGCGKTTNAKKIAAKYRLKKIRDNWDPATNLPQYGFLALTHDVFAMALIGSSYRVIGYDEAMRGIK